MIIFRYLTREIYLTTLAVTSILLAIFMSHQFVRYWSDAALGRLTIQAVLEIMAIQVPILLGFMLPLGLYLGILSAYGRLYVDNEMTIFSACGVSGKKILGMTFGLSFIVMIFVAFLMFWIQPRIINYRDQIIAKSALSSPFEKLSPGNFQKIGNKWVLFVDKISRNHKTVQNVFVANVPEEVVFAKEANQSKDHAIMLSNGVRYVGQPGQSNYKIFEFEHYGVKLPTKFARRENEDNAVSTSKLWRDRHLPQAAAELNWRIGLPISVLILTLFAVPLSQTKPRKGRFAQLLPAIGIYILYLNLLYIGKAWIEKGKIPIFLGMWWIHAIMLLLALFLLFQRGILKRPFS